MTDKINLSSAGSGYNLSTINDNFAKVEDALNNRVLYRDVLTGEVNSILSDIDVNDKRLYNLPEPVDLDEAARLRDVQNAIAGATAANLITATDGAGGSIFTTVQGFITKILSNIGSSIVGFLQTGTGAVNRTVQDKLRERVSVKDFGAVGDGVTDDSAAFQAALDYLYSVGGGLCFVPASDAFYLCNTPLVMKYGVSLKGASSEKSIIQKNTADFVTLTNSATTLAGGYSSGSLPNDLNAILILDGPSSDHRYIGTVSDVCLRGALATPGDFQSQIVEFGIVSLGSVSDYRRIRCKIEQVQYAEIYPIIFVSQLKRTRITNCLHGIFINNGTSTVIEANYISEGRDYGYYIRDLKYSEVSSNACDELNNPVKYPDRTRTCSAYVFRSCLGMTVTNNGDEGTYGRSLEFNEFDHSVCEGHLTARIGSDYIGAAEIAWIYSTALMRGSRITDNTAYNVKASGLISGGANPAKHHNFYFEGLTTVQQIEFHSNVVRASRSGSIAEAGWGNNVPTTWINAARGETLIFTHSPTLTAQTVGNLNVVYGADNQHFVEQRGILRHVWGCFHVTVTHTTASGLLIIDGFQANGPKTSAIQVVGVGLGSGLAAKLGWFEMNPSATGATGRTDGDANFVIGDLPTGTTVRIYYDGWYSTV